MTNTWNPVLNLVKQVKQDYINTYGALDTIHFETWLQKLNNNKYNDIFDCLQMNQKDEYVLIRYGLAEMQRGMWEDENSIYRECRSIVINLEKEELVLTPFRKFFNLNEVDENKVDSVLEKIKNAKRVEVADKLDGSMQNARWYNNEVFMTGSMALDKEDSWRLQEGYEMLTNNYIEMLKAFPNFTFIFEYISLKDAHVVLYKEKDVGMHLIGVRDTVTGKQFSYEVVRDIADNYNVSVVNLEDKSLNQLLQEMKQYQSHEKEGWVINIDGHFIKIKCDDYVNIHRLLDKVSSVNVIIEKIAEDEFDDLLAKIPDKYKERVNSIANMIFDYLIETRKNIKEAAKKAPKGSKKEFMIWVNNNVSKNIQAYVRNEYLGIEYNLLKKGVKGYKRMAELGLGDNYSVLFASVGGEGIE